MRAAFKAVQDGKQVAVLVPTTLLATQHLQTFSDRMRAFPVNVKGLSRFTDNAEAQADDRGPGRRHRGRRRRHAPAAADRGPLEGPRPGDRRRGAALRRRAQGAHHGDAHARRRAHAVRDADPADAGDEPGRHPRDVDDHDAARGPPPHAHLRGRLRRQAGRRRDPPRAAARRPGLLRAQPRVDDRARGPARARAGARGAGRRRARPDERRHRSSARSTGSGTTSPTSWSAPRSSRTASTSRTRTR